MRHKPLQAVHHLRKFLTPVKRVVWYRASNWSSAITPPLNCGSQLPLGSSLVYHMYERFHLGITIVWKALATCCLWKIKSSYPQNTPQSFSHQRNQRRVFTWSVLCVLNVAGVSCCCLNGILFDAALATSLIAVTQCLARSNLREKELSLGKMWWQEARACG